MSEITMVHKSDNWWDLQKLDTVTFIRVATNNEMSLRPTTYLEDASEAISTPVTTSSDSTDIDTYPYWRMALKLQLNKLPLTQLQQNLLKDIILYDNTNIWIGLRWT